MCCAGSLGLRRRGADRERESGSLALMSPIAGEVVPTEVRWSGCRRAGPTAVGGKVTTRSDSAHQIERYLNVGRGQGNRVDDHAALGALDAVNFGRLLFDGHVLVDDAESAELGHGDGQARFGHRVHRGAEDRNIQPDIAGQAGRDIDLGRHEGDVLRQQQHIVEGQGGRDARGDADRGARLGAVPVGPPVRGNSLLLPAPRDTGCGPTGFVAAIVLITSRRRPDGWGPGASGGCRRCRGRRARHVPKAE